MKWKTYHFVFENLAYTKTAVKYMSAKFLKTALHTLETCVCEHTCQKIIKYNTFYRWWFRVCNLSRPGNHQLQVSETYNLKYQLLLHWASG